MYYGYYSSYDQHAHFVSKGQTDLHFPPQVMYKNTAYRLVKCYDVQTPGQLKSFNDFCESQSCDKDVELN